jgi:hypothetical protein
MADTKKTVNLLPEYLRTDKNAKFLSSTLDQFIQTPQLERVDGYVGSKITPTYDPNTDFYLTEASPLRKNYQLEPALIIKDQNSKITDVVAFDDIINELTIQGAKTENLDTLLRTEFYSFNPPIDWDKLVNFDQYYWLPTAPKSILVDNTGTNIFTSVIGQSTYTMPNGYALSNGMNVIFKYSATTGTNTVVAGREYIVEGVGSSIKLVSLDSLESFDSFLVVYNETFDSEQFDDFPFDGDKKLPVYQEYITINRASNDKNSWSRYNRWFHKDVIKTAAEANGLVPTYDANFRAKRPIVEFNADLQLYNFGKAGIPAVNLIDNDTVDAFSTVQGSYGYYVDEVLLEAGFKVIFNADTNPDVRGKVYVVSYDISSGTPILQLTEDYTPSNLDSVSVKEGANSSGTSWHYHATDNVWVYSQQHTNLNVFPLFDLFNDTGVSYTDLSANNFTGCRVFNYAVGSGINDTVLGFPLKYQNSQGVGSYLFQNYFMTDEISITENNVSSVFPTGITFLKYNDGNNTLVNVWTDAEEYKIPVNEIQVIPSSTSSLKVTAFDKPISTSTTVIAYVNNVKVSTTATVSSTGITVNFENTLAVNDTVVLKLTSDQVPNVNGYYEAPLSLTNNPLNGPISDMTLSELSDHVFTAIGRNPNFEGIFPGSSNLRDLSDYAKYGTRFIVNANPISFVKLFFGKKEHNVIDAIRFAGDQYNQFKMNFLKSLINVTEQLTPADALDEILKDINKSKDSKSPNYRSDMLAYGSDNTIRFFTVTDSNVTEYPVGYNFDLDVLSFNSVLVYINGVQQVFGKDYTFNKIDGSVIFDAELSINDEIGIVYYPDTLGCFVPATPSKLGLYPKFKPELVTDDTYLDSSVTMIIGHDGSMMKAYGDYRDAIVLEYEKRIYNNIKVEYNSAILDVNKYLPGVFRDTNNSVEEINNILQKDFMRWAGSYGVNYISNTGFDDGDSYTWNYTGGVDKLFKQPLAGYWRNVFKYFYDTDRPDTHPWEMLGYYEKPTWWDTHYSWTNLLKRANLIDALTYGKTEEFPSSVVNSTYARPGFANVVPVNTFGNLITPNVLLAGPMSYTDMKADWKFGDHAPAETAWRKSSHWPFAISILAALSDPSSYASRMFDISRTSFNIKNQITYKEDDLYLSPKKLVIEGDNNAQIAGFGNFVIERGNQQTVNYTTLLKTDLTYINFNLFHKLGGFASKDKLRIVIDSVDPLTTGQGALLPSEDYSLILNVSNPVKSSRISGIIVQKSNGQFVVKGYDRMNPYFDILKPINTAVSGGVTVGGTSESFTEWSNVVNNSNPALGATDSTTANSTTTRYYRQGQLVRYNGKFYRVKVGHTAQSTFDPALFQSLSGLPVTGGARAALPAKFAGSTTRIPYGTAFSTIQEVYDLIVGYGAYLESEGFVFDQYNTDLNEVVDWKFTGKEFLYWTTQNWSDNNLITLSPFADYLKYSYSNSIVDDVSGKSYDYSLLKADGTPFPIERFTLSREDAICVIKTVNTEDGLFFAVLNSVQKEHGMVFENTTLFNDTIYDIETGYRQRRIKLSGFRTKNWNGDLFSPGFVYDSVEITDWEQYQEYLPGKVVRYNGAYYESKIRVTGSSFFNFNEWVKLSEKPIPDLLPNFDYKINQFEDFYSLDIDNFDAGQQQLAQHLIGYTPRSYLNEIFTNPISQYKFYQGLIKDKGTRNALDKLSKARIFNNQGSIDLKEEWAFRIGHYGGFPSYNEIEIPLEEGTSLENPYIVKFVGSLPSNNNPLVNYYLPTDLLLSPDNYASSSTFKTYPSTFDDTNIELTTAGYIRPDDATFTAYNKNSLLDIANNTLIQNGNTIWVGFLENGGWDIYRYTRQLAKISGVFVSAPASEITFVTNLFHNLSVGDIVSVVRFNEQVNGVYVVTGVPKLNQFTVASTLSTITNEELLAYGALFKFDTARYGSFSDLSKARNLLGLSAGEKIWIDNGSSGKWEVYEKVENFTSTYFTSAGFNAGQRLGYSIHAPQDSNTALVSLPGYRIPSSNFVGRVWVTEKTPSKSIEKLFDFTLNSATETYAANNTATEFGYSMAFDIAKNLYIVGAPSASLVRATSVPGPVTYSTGSGTTRIYDYEGIVKISTKSGNANAELVKRVLAHPYIVNANNSRFGHSVYTTQNAASTSTLLLVGAPGTTSHVGTGSVFAYKLDLTTSTVNVSAHNIFMVGTTSTAVPLTIGSKFGHKISGSLDGTKIAISAPSYTTSTAGTTYVGVVQIFDENLTWKQKIFSPFGTDTEFGSDVAVSSTGKFIAISSIDARRNSIDQYGKVAVYKWNNTSSQYVWQQTIENSASAGNLKFGCAIDFSKDEKTLVISSLGTNRSQVIEFDKASKSGETTFDGATTRFVAAIPDSGTVYVYNNLGDYFIQSEELSNVDILEGSRYGASVVANNNSIFIGAPSYASVGINTISMSTSTIAGLSIGENARVEFSEPELDPGVTPYVLPIYGNVTSTTKDIIGLRIVNAGTGYQSKPVAYLKNSAGTILDTLVVTLSADNSRFYRFNKVDDSTNGWNLLREQPDTVDVTTVKRIALIDSFKEEVIDYLDVFDPLKGKIPGIAEQELKYKAAFDPAVYSIGIAGTVNDDETNWIDEHIGELWWDLSTAKYVWYEQGDEIFRKNNWGKLFPGASIDVYEWVKSDLLPSDWAAQADTNEGLTNGISGQPKYPDNSVVSVKQIFNTVTSSFENVHYFWVKNKVTLPESSNRRISSYQVASIISDPRALGLKFAEVLSSDSIALANVQPSLVGNRINANIVTDNINNEIPRHTEWLLLEEGNDKTVINTLLEKKLVDSLLGHDSFGNQVPANNLTDRNKYGLGIRPQQTIFKDRFEALRNLVGFTNSVLTANRITGNYSFDNLNTKEEIPNEFSRDYDLIVEDLSELEDVETSQFRKATAVCFVSNGKVKNVIITDQGLGYTSPPAITVSATTGTGAVILTEIDNFGRVINATVSVSGNGYEQAPLIEVRSHTVYVQVNENYGNRWTKHIYDYEFDQWIRIKTQTFNTKNYWTYANWIDPSYSPYKDYSYVVSDTYELAKLVDAVPGDYVKVKNIGNDNFAILEKLDNSTVGNFTPSYNIIYSENGTIQILDSIWNYGTGYDVNTLEETLYDEIPDLELQYILTALKEDIFIKDLKVNWNLFFFKAVRYALTEQKLLDWAFKTSFINVQNRSGILDQRSVYKLDNETAVEEYIREIKPYHSKLKDFTSFYSYSDTTAEGVAMSATDFDLPSYYNTTTDKFTTVSLGDNLLGSRPWKDWADNYTYMVEDVIVADRGVGYNSTVSVRILGGGPNVITTATAEAYIRNGGIYKILVTNSGTGYTTSPWVEITGGGSNVTTVATASAILGGSPVRKNTLGLRFDRVSAINEIGQQTYTDTFVCNGTTEGFVLTWLAEPNKTNIVPLLDGKLIFATDYTIEYYTEEFNGYKKKYSKFVFLKQIPKENQVFKITYNKHIDLYTAVDRIDNFYNPTNTMIGDNVALLMDGVEYPQTQIQGLPFDYSTYWDAANGYENSAWEDLVNYYASAKVTATATIGATTLYLNTTTGIVPGQILNMLNTTTNVIRTDTVVLSVSTASRTITISNPSYTLKRIRAANTSSLGIGSSIIVETNSLFKGDIRQGDIAILSGITSVGYNGTYTVDEILGNAKFRVTATSVLSTARAAISVSAAVNVSSLTKQINAKSVFLNNYVYTATNTSTALIVTQSPLADVTRHVVTATTNTSIISLTTVTSTVTLYYSVIQDPSITGRAAVRVYNLNTTTATTININLYSDPAIEFWVNDTNATALDTSISGGSWSGVGMSGALGIAPEDIIIDGDSLLNANAGHAPEECVAGHVVDSLGMNVYTRNTDQSAVIITGAFAVTSLNTTVTSYLSIDDTAIAGIRVSLNGVTYERVTSLAFTDTDQFFIEGRVITLPPQTMVGRVGYTIVTVGGDVLLDSGSVQTYGQSSAIIYSSLSESDIKGAYVLVDGTEVFEVTTSTSYGYMLNVNNPLNNRASVTVYNLPTGNHTVEAWFFDNPYGNYNRFNEQIIQSDPFTTIDTFTLDYPPGNVEPLSSQVIVELSTGTDLTNRLRLTPPWVTYYKVENNQTIFPIETKYQNPEWTGSSYTIDTLKVYANGIILRAGFDYTIDNTGAGSITITSNLLNNGDVLAIELLLPGYYDYVVTGNTLRLTTAIPIPGTSENSLKVTSFTTHDNMNIRTERFFGNGANKRFTLALPPLSDSYVWVSVAGAFLIPNYDFEILEDGKTIQISEWYTINENADIVITSFDMPYNGSQIIGYRIFKDMFDKPFYTRLSKAHTTELSRDLLYTDTEIYVTDDDKVVPPNPAQNKPGVLILDAERIEFFKKEGNVLSQLRRSTLGTGPARFSEAGTKVLDQSLLQRIPYAEYEYKQHILSTTATIYTINTATSLFAANTTGTAITLASSVPAVDQIEVYYGGRRLRKNSIEVHDKAIAYDSNTSIVLNGITTTTNITLAAEFTVTTSTQALHLNIAGGVTTGTRITVIQRQGRIWNTLTESLLTSNSLQAQFLRDAQAELPNTYYYGGDPALSEITNTPLTNDDGSPLEGY